MKKSLLALFTATCLVTTTAQAQDRRPDMDGWQFSVGGGAIFSPNYLGDDAYALSVVPSIRANYGDKFFASVEGGIGYALIDNGMFRAGPLARVEFGRDEAEGGGPFRVVGNDSTDLIGLGDIDTTVSLGGFAEVEMGALTASIKAGQAISAHNGLTGEFGLSYKTVLRDFGPPIILSAGPRIEYGDKDYTGTLFGVTAAQSAASGLPSYTASGGVSSYGVSGTAIMPLTRKVTATMITSYKRLSGDAANAPLVQQRGSKDQFFTGIILSYALN